MKQPFKILLSLCVVVGTMKAIPSRQYAVAIQNEKVQETSRKSIPSEIGLLSVSETSQSAGSHGDQADPKSGVRGDAGELRQIDSLSDWIDRLRIKESYTLCHNEEDCTKEKKRIVDSNGFYSYSCFQFQRGTWDNYAPRYLGKIEPEDIYDCGKQRTVVRAMILENPDSWKHWYNSVAGPDGRGIGLPPK